MHARVPIPDRRRDLVHPDDDLVVLERGDRPVQLRDGALELLLRGRVIEVLVPLGQLAGEVAQVLAPLFLVERRRPGEGGAATQKRRHGDRGRL